MIALLLTLLLASLAAPCRADRINRGHVHQGGFNREICFGTVGRLSGPCYLCASEEELMRLRKIPITSELVGKKEVVPCGALVTVLSFGSRKDNIQVRLMQFQENEIFWVTRQTLNAP